MIMCLILLAYKVHKEYPFILAANRDEFYDRPALPLNYWNDNQEILGGRDLEKMGSWLGISRTGRFAAVTNYRDPSRLRTDVRSRGEIVSAFLNGNDSPREYLKKVKAKRELYNGFNLILGNVSCLLHYSNISNIVEELEPGVHGLSNHLFNTPWPKVVRGKEKLELTVQDKSFPDKKKLFEILSDSLKAADKDLPNTGVGLQRERMMSPIFIESPGYGTRSSTVLLISRQNNVLFIERSKVLDQSNWVENCYEFDIRQIKGGEKS